MTEEHNSKNCECYESHNGSAKLSSYKKAKIYKKVKCELCKKDFYRISNTHLWLSHKGMSMEEYVKKFPKAVIEDPELAHDRVNHLRNKSYAEVYGRKKAKELIKQRVKDAEQQMKDMRQLLIRMGPNNKKLEKKDLDLIYSLRIRAARPSWDVVRKDALSYYGEECQRCGKMEERITVHHIDGNNQNNDIKNLMVLCHSCHSKLHNPKGSRKFIGLTLIEKAAILMMKALEEEYGLNLSDPNFTATPKRIARAYAEIFQGTNDREEIKEILSTSFPTEYNGMVTEGPIRCYSMCPHHFLPVEYDVWVSYIPTNGGLGLSKIPRLVELLAKAPKLQEDYTEEIVQSIDTTIKPKGVMCIVKGDHFCMKMRGVKAQGCGTTTSAVRGIFLKDEPGKFSPKQEFLALIQQELRGNR